MKKILLLCSSLIAVMLMFSGCESTQGVDTGSTVNTETVIAGNSENEDFLSSDNDGAVDDSDTSDGENTETVKKEIIIEPDNSYIYEDLCKVNAEYDETAGGAPVETIVKELRKDSYEGMVLLSHEVKEDTDTVKYKVIPRNISGKGPQYIVCYAEFTKEGDEWSLASKSWSEWVVKANEYNGSNWAADSENVEELSKLFEGGHAFEEGSKVYVHFMKNLNIIAVLSNEDASVYETKIGTKFSGTVFYINGDEKNSVDFTCTEGTVNDDGILSFKLISDNGEVFFTPGVGSSFITKPLYNLIMSDENTDIENAKVLDNLDTFEVKSESIFYGEWIKETGGINGNISPELSWEKVDGATVYAIMMIDVDQGDYLLHAYSTSETNHLDLGALGEDEFYGPQPREPHNYRVYVFALKEAIDPKLTILNQLIDAETLFEKLNKDNPDNVISYGQITASYEYLDRVW